MGYKITLEHGLLEIFWMHCLGLWCMGNRYTLWIINIEMRAEVMEKYGLLKIEINAKQVSFKFRVVSIGAIKTSY